MRSPLIALLLQSELNDKVSLPSTSSKDNNVVQSQKAAKNAPPPVDSKTTNNVKDNVQDKNMVSCIYILGSECQATVGKH